VRAESKQTLRRFALNDERFVESVCGRGHADVETSALDQKTHALVRLGALLAIEATVSSYQPNIAMALAAGASVDEIIGTLVAVAPHVGMVRAVAAAPELALALGYDVFAAFESGDDDVE
jgi:alkylhydroperoxidase/carboxymuconolactone decarboxylase family protein YurZ